MSANSSSEHILSLYMRNICTRTWHCSGGISSHSAWQWVFSSEIQHGSRDFQHNE